MHVLLCMWHVLLCVIWGDLVTNRVPVGLAIKHLGLRPSLDQCMQAVFQFWSLTLPKAKEVDSTLAAWGLWKKAIWSSLCVVVVRQQAKGACESFDEAHVHVLTCGKESWQIDWCVHWCFYVLPNHIRRPHTPRDPQVRRLYTCAGLSVPGVGACLVPLAGCTCHVVLIHIACRTSRRLRWKLWGWASLSLMLLPYLMVFKLHVWRLQDTDDESSLESNGEDEGTPCIVACHCVCVRVDCLEVSQVWSMWIHVLTSSLWLCNQDHAMMGPCRMFLAMNKAPCLHWVGAWLIFARSIFDARHEGWPNHGTTWHCGHAELGQEGMAL